MTHYSVRRKEWMGRWNPEHKCVEAPVVSCVTLAELVFGHTSSPASVLAPGRLHWLRWVH